jgi:hypothetical protein
MPRKSHYQHWLRKSLTWSHNIGNLILFLHDISMQSMSGDGLAYHTHILTNATHSEIVEHIKSLFVGPNGRLSDRPQVLDHFDILTIESSGRGPPRTLKRAGRTQYDHDWLFRYIQSYLEYFLLKR